MAREQPTIAYLGPKSSFTNQAARSLFPESEFYLTPKSTIKDVFEAVRSGVVDRGVVPFENSSNGAVLNTLDLLFEQDEFNDVYVSGEVSLQVNHCLVGYQSVKYHKSTKLMTPPDSPTMVPADMQNSFVRGDYKHIKRIYSHAQALGQCQDFISKYLPHAICIETSSTAQAASVAAQDTTRESAAIASEKVTSISGMKSLSLLATKIQDMAENQTRFFILKHFTPLWHYDLSWMQGDSVKESDRRLLVSFSVDPKIPSSLSDALSIFHLHRVGVISINTRPSRKSLWQNRHVVEFVFEGPNQGNESVIDRMLTDLSEVTRDYKVHGAWDTEFVW